MGRGNISEAHVERQRVAVYRPFKSREFPKGLQFRSKNEVAADESIVERLDANTVTHQVEPPFLAVPESKGKHPDKALHGGMQSPAFDGRQHDLSIGAPAPCMRSEFIPELVEVIDFAIEDDGVTSRCRGHGLVSLRREIHDGKAAERKA